MPAKKITLLEAPFDRFGSLLHWAEPRYSAGRYGGMSETVTWRPNEPFHATLRLDSTRSGRSAKYVIWVSPNGSVDPRTFPMFVTDLVDTIQHAKQIDHGIISARWIVRKRGQNYGLALAPEIPSNG